MYQKFSLLLPLLLLCSSCIESSVEIPAYSQPLPPRPSLNPVIQGKSIEIYNDWNGYSDITPVLRHYKLQLKQQQFSGNAYIAVGGYGIVSVRQQQTTRVKLPAAMSTKFLKTLAQTPLRIGEYKPLLSRIDDYPSITIQIQDDRQHTIFSSQSQGVGYAPWRITIIQGQQQQSYISNSTIPAQALNLLKPYIDTSGIDRLIQRRRHQQK